MDHKVSKDMISSGMTPSGEKTQADLGRTQYGSAPSPSRLMDAYKSMYQNQEKENLDEMKMPPKKMFNPNTQGVDLLKKRVSGEMSADQVDKAIVKSRGATPTKEPSLPKFKKTDNPSFKKPESKSMVDTVRDRRQEVVSDRREKAQKIMSKYGESVDLLAAYRSVYEHHKKDADGNTIPHEHEEELDEGKIPAGLQAYLDKKKGKKEDKKEDKKEVKEGADLFDVIVTHFIDEGYEEKEVHKAMSNLTEDQLQNLHEVLPALGAIGAALKSGAVASKVGAVAGKVGAFASKAGSVASKGLASAGKAIPTSIKNVGKTIKGNVSSGLNKPFNPRVTQGPKPASMQGPRQANFGDKLKNIGRGVKDFYKSKDVGMGDKVLATTMAVDTVGKLGGSMRPRGLQKSDTDLFDIVKGQLLDEGLSEEEIKDIMLTLTPDEIMEELSDIVKKNDAINKANAMKAAQERKVPDKVREASKRQYTAGGPKDKGENKYTTQDKKTIIDYHKNKGSM